MHGKERSLSLDRCRAGRRSGGRWERLPRSRTFSDSLYARARVNVNLAAFFSSLLGVKGLKGSSGRGFSTSGGSSSPSSGVM
jgi:hypothetical protein